MYKSNIRWSVSAMPFDQSNHFVHPKLCYPSYRFTGASPNLLQDTKYPHPLFFSNHQWLTFNYSFHAAIKPLASIYSHSYIHEILVILLAEAPSLSLMLNASLYYVKCWLWSISELTFISLFVWKELGYPFRGTTLTSSGGHH